MAPVNTDRLMRQSLINSSDICLKRTGYQSEGLWAPSEPALVGTAYHAGLEAFFNGEEQFESVVKAFAVLTQADQDGFEWETSLQDAIDRVANMLQAYWPNAWHDTIEVIGTELSFTEPWINGWQAHGTVDLLFRNDYDGRLVIDDHKTAKRKWPANKHDIRHSVQSAWYCYWIWQQYAEMPSFVYSIMTYAGFFERRWVNPTMEQMLTVVKKAENLAYLLDNVPVSHLPTNTTTPLCSEKYCPAWEACPCGAELAS